MPRWFLWTLAALVSWGLWAIASKLVGEALSPVHNQALSTLGMVPVVIALAVMPAKKPAAGGRNRRGAALAVAAGWVTCLGNVTYYAALQQGQKAVTVIPLTALYPVVTILLAVGFLGERPRKVQWCGIGLSLVATYLFNVPGETGFFSPAVLHALPPILLWGFSGWLQKLSTQHVSGEHSAFWFLLSFVPVALGIALLHPLPLATIPGSALAWVMVLGLCFAFGNFAILAAFAAGGQASLIAPLGSLYPLLSVPIAVLALHETIGGRELTGVILALVSVVALSLESSQSSEALPCNPSPNS